MPLLSVKGLCLGCKERNKMKRIFFDRYGNLRECWIVVMFLVAILGIVLVAVGIVAILEYAKCGNLESIDQINQYDWSLWSGCRVQTSAGFFVDVDSPSMYELIRETPR